MPLRPLIAALLICAGTGADLLSQAPREGQPYASGTTAILVDVVVRDKKGRPVTDLSAAEFEIAEDGIPQKVDTFTRVSRGAGIGVGIGWRKPANSVAISAQPPDSPPAGVEPAIEQATTAIVFDHLSSESLRLAQTAALAYIPLSGESTSRVAVFATEPGIRVVQPYTTDHALVRQAVGRVLPSGTSAEEQKAERAEDLMTRRRELRGQSDAMVAGSGGSGGAALAGSAAALGERENELRLIQTELNMIRSFDSVDREQKGYGTSLALLTVVRSLAEYPGRKTIVFFSEGLPVSPALSARLDRVIDAANRANVTAYAVDASGLRAKSTLTNMRKEMETFAEERMIQVASGSDRTEQPLTMAFERVEDTLKLDSRTGLARLAEDTGGFLFEGTNDLSSVFRRIDEDTQFHYLLTYSPTNGTLDGRFRTIQVKVRRPRTDVFARKGYRALRTPALMDAASRDLTLNALSLLTRAPLPNAFPVHAASFSFPDPERPGLTPVLVRVQTDVLQFDLDARRSAYSGQAAVVVRVRDAQGHDVQKVSQEYVLTGAAKDVDAARRGEILFYRELDMAPGVYTIESIVFDAAAERGSVRVATLTVPETRPSSLGMSSLVIVKRVEEINERRSTEPHAIGPLYVGNTLLYPSLGEPIQRSAGFELPFYFTAYGSLARVNASAQLLRNGQPLAEAPLDLPPARGSRMQHVGRIPLDGLAAGTYELRIRLTDGRQELSRAAFFTLKD
jgi:VWFA-related protein